MRCVGREGIAGLRLPSYCAGVLAILCVLGILAHAPRSHAQIPPGSGRVLEELREPARPPVLPPSDIRIEPQPADKKADTPPFYVAGFRVTGATVFPEAQLLEILGPAGRELTLGGIQERADRLTKFYNDRGYSVARALVPAQDVREGIVEIRVLEGRYGRIDIRNATELSETRIRAVLGEAKEGALIRGPELERSILLLSDLAGVRPKATLEPGESAGLTDLVLEIAEGPRVEFDAMLDNAGSRYTGRDRLGVGVVINSPAEIGDRLSARVVTSGDQLFSLRAAYDLPLGASGLRAGPYVYRTSYHLGDTFKALDASGTADGRGGLFSYPLIRSSALNLRAHAGGEVRKLEDRVDAISTVTHKKAKLAQFGFSGEARDDFLAGGLTSFQAQVTGGRLSLQSPGLEAIDAAGPNTQGGYAKLVAGFYRLQGLSEDWRLGVSFLGQWARDNLDSSEKMSVGGLAGVRAYPVGEAPGDEAMILQLELRHQGFPVLAGQLSPFGFFDAARSHIFHKPFDAQPGKNLREMSGYGVGVEWFAAGYGFVRAWYARKAGSYDATAEPDRSSRFWIQTGVAF